MRIYKRGKCWYIDYSYKGRRMRKKVGQSKKVAELTLKDIELERLNKITPATFEK